MSNDASQSRSRKAVTVVGLAGITGGLVLGGTMVASAANPSGFATTATECTSQQAAVVPQVPFFRTSFVVKSNKVQGNVPAPTAQQLNGLTAQNVVVRLTTQYSTKESGGAGKKDRVTVVGANGTFFNPIGDIPPVVNQNFVPPTGTTVYSGRTTGRAAAKITVEAFIGDATRTVKTLTLGTTCPAGSTATGSIEGNTVARPSAPTNATATPGTAAGSARVNFVGSTNQGGDRVTSYTIFPTDLTTPSRVDDSQPVTANTDGTFTLPATVTGLKSGDSYTFKVVANNSSSSSEPSNTTTPITIP